MVVNRPTFIVYADPPLPKVKLAKEFATTRVLLSCGCGLRLSARTTDAVTDAYADHRAYVHGVPR